MSERFYQPTCTASGPVYLEGEEAAHLVKVMRARVGDAIVLFDGKGREFDAEIAETGKRKVLLRVGTCRKITRMPPRRLTLATAVPKGQRMNHLVELCAAFGVARLIPVDTTRSVASAMDAGQSKQARWARIAVETAKQCGRNVLMDITPMTLSDVLSDPAPPPTKLLATTLGAARPVREVLPATGDVVVLVGPEGGFTAEEVEQGIQAGFQPVSLGEAILRIEHAAAAIAALTLTGLNP